ncbi:MAG: 5-carboxymethyl-2-hydroxymuconate Delta-isomerase [Bacteroidota bacterium]
MPHLIIDCPEILFNKVEARQIMEEVYQAAASTGLFALEGTGGIKVRIRPYTHYFTVGKQDDFIHVFGYIMAGRTSEQKKSLSTKVVSTLNRLFPDVSIISMNIQDFDKETYCNKSMIV